MTVIEVNVLPAEPPIEVNVVEQLVVEAGAGSGIVETIVAGDNVTVDDTDPANPIVSSTGGSGAVDSVNGETGVVVLSAGDIGSTATGDVAATNVQGAIAELASEKATVVALAAEAVLARNADNLTSGTVADARIASTIARDSEVTSAVAAEATLARNADNLTSGTVADARIASSIARDSEVTSAVADEATLARNADNLTSGTVADARIAATIARDSEVTSAVAAEATLARNADNLSSGTVADARIASTIARDSEVTSAVAAEATLARNADNLTSGTVANARLDADLQTYAGITPGALGQAILPMTTLTDKGLVLGRAAAAPAALAPDAATTKFLKNSVASGDPTWQLIAESDVTNLTTDLSALQTQTTLQAAKQDARVIADTGYFVASGLALTPNGTPTKLDMAAGVQFVATTELNATAQSAISTTIASLADATNPKWVVVELDGSNVVQFNQGTAAAAPAFPTLTATRVPLGFLFVPANATNVDVLLTTNNGLAKLIDARNLRSVHPSRILDANQTATTLTNATALTSMLTATTTIPANSLSVGDMLVFELSGSYTNSQNNSTTEWLFSVGGVTIFDYTSPSLNSSASVRKWTLRYVMMVTTLGASGTVNTGAEFKIAPPGASVMTSLSLGGGAGGDMAVGSANPSIVDTTAAMTVDIQYKLGTSSSTSVLVRRVYVATKHPR